MSGKLSHINIKTQKIKDMSTHDSDFGCPIFWEFYSDDSENLIRYASSLQTMCLCPRECSDGNPFHVCHKWDYVNEMLSIGHNKFVLFHYGIRNVFLLITFLIPAVKICTISGHVVTKMVKTSYYSNYSWVNHN